MSMQDIIIVKCNIMAIKKIGRTKSLHLVSPIYNRVLFINELFRADFSDKKETVHLLLYGLSILIQSSLLSILLTKCV